MGSVPADRASAVEALQQTLLERTEHFLQVRRMNASEFGRRAVNDRSLVRDLRDRRNMTLRKLKMVEAFLSENSDGR
jgi:hypothetical protein